MTSYSSPFPHHGDFPCLGIELSQPAHLPPPPPKPNPVYSITCHVSPLPHCITCLHLLTRQPTPEGHRSIFRLATNPYLRLLRGCHHVLYSGHGGTVGDVCQSHAILLTRGLGTLPRQLLHLHVVTRCAHLCARTDVSQGRPWHCTRHATQALFDFDLTYYDVKDSQNC